ncbi:MAG TPA: FmdB family zinc ribbon protein [Candidatus Eisenbacteria bacterium]|jgi:putative FmdB family regulatory protein
MPTYTYRCRKCGHRFDLFHGIKDESPKRCPKCRSRADRVPAGGAGILFKGSGFYITDHRSPSYREKAKQERTAGGSGAAGEGKQGKGASKPPSPSRGKGAGSAGE